MFEFQEKRPRHMVPADAFSKAPVTYSIQIRENWYFFQNYHTILTCYIVLSRLLAEGYT
jgi:hypothetical protein